MYSPMFSSGRSVTGPCSHRARLGFSNSSSFWWPATVVWNRRDISYRPHFKACSLQGSNSRIASGSWAFHTNFQRAHSGLTRAIGGGERGLVCGERCSFSRAFKTERTGTRPAHDITFHIRYRHGRVIKRRLNVRHTRRNDLLFLLLCTLFLGLTSHLYFTPLGFCRCLLPHGDGAAPWSLACARIRMSALASRGQSPPVAESAVGTDFHQPL